MKREAWTVQEEMLIVFNTSLTCTGRAHAVKVVSEFVTTKITELDTKSSKKLNAFEIMNSESGSSGWSNTFQKFTFEL